MTLPVKSIFPSRGLAADINNCLLEAIEAGCSDITLMPDQVARGDIGGRMVALSKGAIPQSELKGLLSETYSEQGVSRVAARPLDYAHEVMTSDRARRRFRFNVTRTYSGGKTGYHFSIRVLEILPPLLHEIGLSENYVAELMKDRGLLIVGGSTGQGKTTTLAAICRYLLSKHDQKLVTVEDPIEYIYEDLPDTIGFAAQHEIGRGLETWEVGLENALRQNPFWILLQEIRSWDTAKTAMAAVQTGHPLMATIHVNSASEAIHRLVNMCPAELRQESAFDLLQCLNTIIAQRLLPKKSGGKIAVREVFSFNADHREALLKQPASDWPHYISAILKEEQRDMQAEIARLVENDTVEQEWIKWTSR